jgi:hypothetical protein
MKGARTIVETVVAGWMKKAARALVEREVNGHTVSMSQMSVTICLIEWHIPKDLNPSYCHYKNLQSHTDRLILGTMALAHLTFNMDWKTGYHIRNFCIQLKVCKCEQREWQGSVLMTQTPENKLVLKGLNMSSIRASVEHKLSLTPQWFCFVKHYQHSASQHWSQVLSTTLHLHICRTASKWSV